MIVKDLMQTFIELENMANIIVRDLDGGAENNSLYPNGSEKEKLFYYETMTKISNRKVRSFWFRPEITTSLIINITITTVLVIELD